MGALALLLASVRPLLLALVRSLLLALTLVRTLLPASRAFSPVPIRSPRAR